MKRYRQYGNRVFGIIVFLIFFLGVSVVIYTDSREQTLENQRKNSYGAWHAAVYHAGAQENVLLENAMVEQTGILTVAGMAADKNGAAIGGIGSAEPPFLSMGNITLLNGRMPEKENEIAVEASRLIDMGYSYEPGQRITLSVQTADAVAPAEQREFTLTGVIRNYTDYWKTDGASLVSFFITPQMCRQIAGDAAEDRHLFLVLKTGFVRDVDSLQSLCTSRSRFVKNDYVYRMYSEGGQTGDGQLLPVVILLLVGCAAITLLISADLTRQRDRFVIMRVLGAEKMQILRIYALQALPPAVIGAAVGTLSGIAIPFLFFHLPDMPGQSRICFTFSVPHVVGVLFLFLVGIFFSAAVGFLRLFQLPLRGISVRQASVQHIPGHRKPLNSRNLFAVLNRLHRKRQLLSVLFVFTSMTFILFSFYYAWENYRNYREYCVNYPDDYSFGTMLTYYPPRDSMPGETLQELSHIYGVSVIRTAAISDYSAITFSGNADPEYLSFVREKMTGMIGEEYSRLPSEAGGVLTGVSDNLLPVYLQQADSVSASFSGDALNPDEAILYLPDYLEADGTFTEYNAADAPSDGTVYRERSIQPGDYVTFTGTAGTARLRIAGIIHHLPKDFPASLNPIKPFSLLCSKETFTDIQGSYEPAYLLIQADDSAVACQTDVELSKVQTRLYFDNFRLEKDAELQSLTVQWILALVLCVSGFLATTLIRLGINISSEQTERSRYETLWQLGMDRRAIAGHLLLSGLRENGSSAALSITALFLVQCGKEWFFLTDIAADSHGGALPLIGEAFQRAVRFTDWGVILAAAILTLSVHFMVTAICSFCLLRQIGRRHPF